MAAEQTDVLVSIHSIVIRLEQFRIREVLILLLREVEVVCEFDTCIKISQTGSVGLRCREDIYGSYRRTLRSGYVHERFHRTVVLEAVVNAVVRVCTKAERVTALQRPLVSEFSRYHHVDGELVSVIRTGVGQLVVFEITGDHLIGNVHTLSREVSVDVGVGDVLLVRRITALRVGAVRRAHALRLP